MRNLEFQLNQVGWRNKDGSFNTQADRRSLLRLIGRQLYDLGYRHLEAQDLKGRHIHALLRLWQGQDLSLGTLKNRMSTLRWLCEKLGKAGIMARSNARYGIESRTYVPRVSKAQHVSQDQLAAVGDPWIRLSLELQREFGLRRAECLLIRVSEADTGSHLALQRSWTKGGRARTIPILETSQRDLLERIKAFLPSPGSSLIPPDRSLKDQTYRYKAATRRAGLSSMHGLRHCYAQRRYETLTGLPAPVHWTTPRPLTPQERQADHEARELIAEELGHGRAQIVTTYIGSLRTLRQEDPDA